MSVTALWRRRQDGMLVIRCSTRDTGMVETQASSGRRAEQEEASILRPPAVYEP